MIFILLSKQQWVRQTIYLSHFTDEKIEVNLCYINCEGICGTSWDNQVNKTALLKDFLRVYFSAKMPLHVQKWTEP